MPISGSPTVRRRRLAAELRRLRRESGKTAEAIAAILGWSKAKVSRYELAQGGLRPRDVERLLDVYGVLGTHREHLLTLAVEASEKGWWEAYADVLSEEHLALIGLEAEAITVHEWQINVVPGLLQTERYARETLAGYQEVRASSPFVLEERVKARMIRQRVLTRDQPLKLHAIVDESVLRRQLADQSVMRQQLRHLAAISKLPNVTLGVLPFDGSPRLAVNSFQILSFGLGQLHDVVSTEVLHDYLFIE
jgi:transcriptional regulator with XRE-family HTH domain